MSFVFYGLIFFYKVHSLFHRSLIAFVFSLLDLKLKPTCLHLNDFSQKTLDIIYINGCFSFNEIKTKAITVNTFIKNMGAYLTFRLGYHSRMVSEVKAKPTKQVKQVWQRSKEIGEQHCIHFPTELFQLGDPRNGPAWASIYSRTDPTQNVFLRLCGNPLFSLGLSHRFRCSRSATHSKYIYIPINSLLRSKSLYICSSSLFFLFLIVD